MRKAAVLLISVFILGFAGGCASWREGIKAEWKRTEPELKYKQVTPAMEVEMEQLIKQGCDRDYLLMDRKMAQMYAIIPGGGQIYTGEYKKAVMYIAGTILIVPYFASFDDARNSVDYYNLQATIKGCRERLRLLKARGLQEKVAEVKSAPAPAPPGASNMETAPASAAAASSPPPRP